MIHFDHRGRWPSFTDKDTRATKGEVILLRSHSWWAANWDVHLRSAPTLGAGWATQSSISRFEMLGFWVSVIPGQEGSKVTLFEDAGEGLGDEEGGGGKGRCRKNRGTTKVVIHLVSSPTKCSCLFLCISTRQACDLRTSPLWGKDFSHFLAPNLIEMSPLVGWLCQREGKKKSRINHSIWNGICGGEEEVSGRGRAGKKLSFLLRFSCNCWPASVSCASTKVSAGSFRAGASLQANSPFFTAWLSGCFACH